LPDAPLIAGMENPTAAADSEVLGCSGSTVPFPAGLHPESTMKETNRAPAIRKYLFILIPRVLAASYLSKLR